MTTASSDHELRVGSSVWFDGQGWTIAELSGSGVRLLAEGRARMVSLSVLANAVVDDRDDRTDSPEDSPTTWEIPSVTLAGLTRAQGVALTKRVQVLRRVLEPEVGDDRSVLRRYDDEAKAIGVSRRTLQRQGSRLLELGPSGLVDTRLVRQQRPSVDPRWDSACLDTLESMTNASNPSRKAVIKRATLAFLQAVPDGKAPSPAVAYRRLEELDKGRYTFGAAKQRRSVARRPSGVLGRLRADRPGQYVVLDTYRMDVFAMEPITLRWVNTELTVAMDLFDRCITGLRLRPVAARSPDVASVLYQTVTAQTWGWTADSPQGPYAGLPDGIVLGDPGGVLPDTIVIDHGAIYLAEHTRGVCERLGISIQPAIPYKPTDKPTLERFFRTLRQSLLENLPGYKGPDVHTRAENVEAEAFYYVGELEQLIREWVGRVYHHTAHAGLVDPLQPDTALSPAEMFARGIAAAGRVRIPASADLVYDFLEVEWRTIQHYGVEIDGQRYDGPGLNDYRNTRSPYRGAHPGKWPFLVDRDDIRVVFFKDPGSGAWHKLTWEHAPGIDAPFSADAARYVRGLSVRANRHVDPQQAVQDLLADWTKGEVVGRRHRNLAIRLSTQRAASHGEENESDARNSAAVPALVDLLVRRDQSNPLVDDLDDVFATYYAAHPDAHGLEVFEE